MDEIHPILPVTDRIPPVTIVPRVARSKRRSGDEDSGEDRRRRPAHDPDSVRDGEDDGRPHVDVTA